MSDFHSRRLHGFAKTSFASIAIFMAASVLLLWSWNTLAADLFHMPEAEFRHAVAFGGMAAGVLLFFYAFIRIGSGGRMAIHRRNRDVP